MSASTSWRVSLCRCALKYCTGGSNEMLQMTTGGRCEDLNRGKIFSQNWKIYCSYRRFCMIYTGWEDRRDLSHWTHLLRGHATIFPLPTAFPHLFPLYLREGSRYQIGLIFGKIPNGLCPPPHFWNIILQIFCNGYGCIYANRHRPDSIS